MTAAERIVFLGSAIEAAEPGSDDWIILLELFTRELMACNALLFATAEPASDLVQ